VSALRAQGALAQGAASLQGAGLPLLGLRCRRGSERRVAVLGSRTMDDGHENELHPAIRGLKTVCRCNNVKYRTIERAIRNGACSVTQVALCTTATTGHCGGSCTPDIQQMIAELAIQRPLAAAAPAASAAAWWVRKQ
jgi:NAD(P)H-nitrite reductase large subunit